jgi:hypothetical protein
LTYCPTWQTPDGWTLASSSVPSGPSLKPLTATNPAAPTRDAQFMTPLRKAPSFRSVIEASRSNAVSPNSTKSQITHSPLSKLRLDRFGGLPLTPSSRRLESPLRPTVTPARRNAETFGTPITARAMALSVPPVSTLSNSSPISATGNGIPLSQRAPKAPGQGLPETLSVESLPEDESPRKRRTRVPYEFSPQLVFYIRDAHRLTPVAACLTKRRNF